MKISLLNKIKVYCKFLLRLKKYRSLFSDFEIQMIRKELLYLMLKDGIGNKSMILEVFADLGVFADDKNPYKQSANLIQKEYGVGCNILDVGCGQLPMKSIYLYEKQQLIGKGSVFAMDPDLRLEKYKNMILIGAPFDYSTDLSNIHLLTGDQLNDGAETVIRRGNENRIPICISLGEDGPFTNEDDLCNGISVSEWQENMFGLAASTLLEGADLTIERGTHPRILIKYTE